MVQHLLVELPQRDPPSLLVGFAISQNHAQRIAALQRRPLPVQKLSQQSGQARYPPALCSGRFETADLLLAAITQKPSEIQRGTIKAHGTSPLFCTSTPRSPTISVVFPPTTAVKEVDGVVRFVGHISRL